MAVPNLADMNSLDKHTANFKKKNWNAAEIAEADAKAAVHLSVLVNGPIPGINDKPHDAIITILKERHNQILEQTSVPKSGGSNIKRSGTKKKKGSDKDLSGEISGQVISATGQTPATDQPVAKGQPLAIDRPIVASQEAQTDGPVVTKQRSTSGLSSATDSSARMKAIIEKPPRKPLLTSDEELEDAQKAWLQIVQDVASLELQAEDLANYIRVQGQALDEAIQRHSEVLEKWSATARQETDLKIHLRRSRAGMWKQTSGYADWKEKMKKWEPMKLKEQFEDEA